MKKSETVLIYIILFSVIIFCSFVIYKMAESKKERYNELYSESTAILDDLGYGEEFRQTNNLDDSQNSSASNSSNSNRRSSKSNTERITQESINAFIRINKLDIFYPVIENTTMNNLQIAPTKLWGGDPNTVGNYCVIGHNLENNELFSNIKTLRVGDTAELIDLNGNEVQYSVYNIYQVDENDLSFTSQNTDGKRELTLVTCTNHENKRLVIKCQEVL